MALTSSKSLGIGLILASLLPLSHGATLFAAQNQFIAESTAARATVVGLESAPPEPGEKSSVNVYSVVEFVDDEGIRRSQRANVSSYPPVHSVGEEIVIRFHRFNSEDVRLASFTGMWFESAFFLIPGLATLLGGIALLLKGRQRTQ